MRLDKWLFGGDLDIISRTEKAEGYFMARREQNTKFLVFWRIMCLVYFTVTEVIYWTGRQEDSIPVLLFMTNQGHYFFGLFNLLTLVAYIRHELIGEPLPADSGSPWLLWKWVSVLFNLLISLQFWTVVLFWTMWFVYSWDEVDTKKLPIYGVVSKHGIYFALLLVDAGLNKIHVEYNQWAVVALYNVGYNLTLIVARFGFNQIVYPFMTYDSLVSWGFFLVSLALVTVSHLLFYVVAKQRTFESSSSS